MAIVHRPLKNGVSPTRAYVNIQFRQGTAGLRARYWSGILEDHRDDQLIRHPEGKRAACLHRFENYYTPSCFGFGVLMSCLCRSITRDLVSGYW